VRGGGAERAAGPRPFNGQSTAEGIDIEADGGGEGPVGAEAIHAISVPPKEAVLGQSLLGEGLLCGYIGR